MINDLLPYILSVVTDGDDVECSDFDYIDDARNYGRYLIEHQNYKSYVIEATGINALSPINILEVYP